tara:strand:- start:257 stop:1003 length:747 start_codon:yes stop_codon:yes gene_type:complete
MDERTFLVTGASKGIGRAISTAMAEQGTRVILLALDTEELYSTETSIQEISPNSFAIACDLSNPSAIQDSVKTIRANVQALDGIVHNAAVVTPIKPIGELDMEDWMYTSQVNLNSAQYLTRGLYSLMQAAGRSRVTTISSIGSVQPTASWASSCVTKAGLDMWAQCLAEEGKEEGISAIIFDPGSVNTDAQKAIRSTPPEDFPSLSVFIDFYENGQLLEPSYVAEKGVPLMLGHTMDQSGERFNIRVM